MLKITMEVFLPDADEADDGRIYTYRKLYPIEIVTEDANTTYMTYEFLDMLEQLRANVGKRR